MTIYTWYIQGGTYFAVSPEAPHDLTVWQLFRAKRGQLCVWDSISWKVHDQDAPEAFDNAFREFFFRWRFEPK